MLSLTTLATLAAVASSASLSGGIPSTPLYFEQRVDHFTNTQKTYAQRYYQNLTSFRGPGSPIICIIGGEGAIPPTVGIYYPSIVVLAARLGAAIIEPEHRFFGTSLPVSPYDTEDLGLLTPQQALADTANFIEAQRAALGCTGYNGEPRCPVITVGGSYPGWLSAMMRLRYPAVVDMSYAASAPMKFYSQAVNQYDYYRVVTESAEKAVPSCPAAVRRVLASTLAAAADKAAIVSGLDLCAPLPPYLDAGSVKLLVEEVSMVIMYTFADLNMGNWPPASGTRLELACNAFVAGAADGWPTLQAFMKGYAAERGAAGCYNMSAQLPAGARATISSGDWSGVGTGQDGASWDLETVRCCAVNTCTTQYCPSPSRPTSRDSARTSSNRLERITRRTCSSRASGPLTG